MRNTPVRYKQHTNILMLLRHSSFVTSILVLVSAWALASCDGRTVEPPVPWATQLSIAQQAAAKVDKNATLWHVVASPVQFPHKDWNYVSDTLRVSFDFYVASGDFITVVFEDTAPSSTLQVKQHHNPDLKGTFTPAQTPLEFSQSLATVKLGPREAAEQVWQDTLLQASQRGEKIMPVIMGLELGSVPAEWIVQCIDVDKGSLNLGYEFLFKVDAQAGQITKRDYKPWSPDFTDK